MWKGDRSVPEYLAPGVFVEEVSFRAKSIEGVGTSTTAFIGPMRKGPLGGTPEIITSFGEFERIYGGLANLSFSAGGDADPPNINYLAHAVRAYFDNEGARLYVARTYMPRTNPDGSVISGIAQSDLFVNVGGQPSGQARFFARMPGSGLNATIQTREQISPASPRTINSAVAGTLLRVGGNPARPALLEGKKPPFALNNGDQLSVIIAGGAAQTITFNGASAEATGAALGANVNLAADTPLVLNIAGFDQTITIPAGTYAPADLVAQINPKLRRGYARLQDTNRLVIGTDARGASVNITVTQNPTLGFATATTGIGSGNVANLELVTVDEINTLLSTAGIQARAALTPESKLVITTTASGAGARLLVNDTTARAALALPGSEAQGTAGAAVLYYRKVGDGWIGGANRVTPLNTTIPLTTAAEFVSLTVVVTDGDDNIISYDDLGFDASHPRYIGAVLKQNPSRRADAIQSPCYIDIGASVDAFDLHDGLCGTLGSKTFLLAGGNDGVEPVATSTLGAAQTYDEALLILEQIDDIAIIAAPGHSAFPDFQTIQSRLISHAERMKYRIAVLDTPEGQTISQARDVRSRIDSTYAALYYPWVVVANPGARPGNERIPREITLPPSGFITGIYARTDIRRGVWKAPANEIVRGILRFEVDINKGQQEVLNPEGVNCLRSFPNRGMRVWGARTATSDPEWKYVNVRRYFIYLEHSIDRSTQWAVFEPNGEALWANITETVSSFLFNEWRSGALLGSKPEQSYFVRCDRSTMTQNDLDNGRLICQIGVAPLKPAEFVIFRIGQKTADARA
jgi:phage tail sheath protein FI